MNDSDGSVIDSGKRPEITMEAVLLKNNHCSVGMVHPGQVMAKRQGKVFGGKLACHDRTNRAFHSVCAYKKIDMVACSVGCLERPTVLGTSEVHRPFGKKVGTGMNCRIAQRVIEGTARKDANGMDQRQSCRAAFQGRQLYRPNLSVGQFLFAQPRYPHESFAGDTSTTGFLAGRGVVEEKNFMLQSGQNQGSIRPCKARTDDTYSHGSTIAETSHQAYDFQPDYMK
jgi:hypothetical protein